LTEPLGRFGPDRGRPFRLLVDADVGVEPPGLAFLVDFAFADEEARIQPAIRLRFSRQLDTRASTSCTVARVSYAQSCQAHRSRGVRERARSLPPGALEAKSQAGERSMSGTASRRGGG